MNNLENKTPKIDNKCMKHSFADDLFTKKIKLFTKTRLE